MKQINYLLVGAFWYNHYVKLFTIGYEGISSEAFFSFLVQANVHTLIDVRQMPLSRKKGFSKSALSTAASDKNIRYLHWAEFGCPKTIRDTYKENGDWKHYEKEFVSYLQTQDKALAKLLLQAQAEVCCLVCFEADPNRCHRSLIACRVVQQSQEGLRVVHLGSQL